MRVRVWHLKQISSFLGSVLERKEPSASFRGLLTKIRFLRRQSCSGTDLQLERVHHEHLKLRGARQQVTQLLVLQPHGAAEERREVAVQRQVERDLVSGWLQTRSPTTGLSNKIKVKFSKLCRKQIHFVLCGGWFGEGSPGIVFAFHCASIRTRQTQYRNKLNLPLTVEKCLLRRTNPTGRPSLFLSRLLCTLLYPTKYTHYITSVSTALYHFCFHGTCMQKATPF